jgi:hypothetical protein
LGGALLLAIVEGSFYSLVAPEREPIRLPLIDVMLSWEAAWFSWGFVLPLVLFGLGHMFYRALTEVVSGHTVAAFRTDAKRLRRELEQLNKSSANLNEAADRARDHMRDRGGHRKP